VNPSLPAGIPGRIVRGLLYPPPDTHPDTSTRQRHYHWTPHGERKQSAIIMFAVFALAALNVSGHPHAGSLLFYRVTV